MVAVMSVLRRLLLMFLRSIEDKKLKHFLKLEPVAWRLDKGCLLLDVRVVLFGMVRCPRICCVGPHHVTWAFKGPSQVFSTVVDDIPRFPQLSISSEGFWSKTRSSATAVKVESNHKDVPRGWLLNNRPLHVSI